MAGEMGEQPRVRILGNRGGHPGGIKEIRTSRGFTGWEWRTTRKSEDYKVIQ